MKRSIGIMVLALLSGACAEAATDTTDATSAPPAITVRGVAVDDPDGVLALGEQRLNRDDHESARCYFSSFADSTDIAPILRCGPARGADSSRLGPWLTLGLTATTVDPIVLSIDADYGRGWDLLRDERVLRLDGLTPPAEENRDLPPPTAFDRTVHPIVRELPIDFQRCMLDRGWLVFRAEFLYDGTTRPEMFDELDELQYVAHETLSFEVVDAAVAGAAALECGAEVAATWDLAFVG